jgi:acylphosphatase
MEELHAIVSGRVQMVMMRDFVQRSASKIGVVGLVRNLPDGTVEVIAQGERPLLEQLVAKLHKGSLLSHVEGVKVDWREAGEIYQGFRIDYGA